MRRARLIQRRPNQAPEVLADSYFNIPEWVCGEDQYVPNGAFWFEGQVNCYVQPHNQILAAKWPQIPPVGLNVWVGEADPT